MFSFSDLVALAKQGYTPADIKELIELSKTTEKEDSKPSEGDTITENYADVEMPSNTVAKEPEEVKEEPDQEDSKIVDYKKKVEDLEKKIADLQKANTEKNIADTDDNKSDLDVLAEAMKSFM